MVKRYEEIMKAIEADWKMVGLSAGIYGDFAATVARRSEEQLKAALREALDAWEKWADKGLWGKASPNRIDELRKQFLDT